MKPLKGKLLLVESTSLCSLGQPCGKVLTHASARNAERTRAGELTKDCSPRRGGRPRYSSDGTSHERRLCTTDPAGPAGHNSAISRATQCGTRRGRNRRCHFEPTATYLCSNLFRAA